jgi:hypothetical protein
MTTSHVLLALEPADWEAVVDMRSRGRAARLVELRAHAASTNTEQSLCGVPVVIAEPATVWSGWLEDEWVPITRCPTCTAAVN